MVKQYLAQGLLGDSKPLMSATKESPESQALIIEMVDEGLVSESQLLAMGVGG